MPDLEHLLTQLMKSGTLPSGIQEEIKKAAESPGGLEALLKRLTPLLGPMGVQDTLVIEDYYHEGDGSKFELRWELGATNPLVASGMSFDMLDRKTQFFTLFAEWQRREMEGMSTLNGGNLEGAREIFNECVQRAEQIDVAELRARSDECLARVAERAGEPDEVIRLLSEAETIRGSS